MNWLIIVSLLFILGAFFMIYFEYREAKNYCDSISGEYEMKMLLGIHLCNDELLIKMRPHGWLLESEKPIDINNIPLIILEKD